MSSDSPSNLGSRLPRRVRGLVGPVVLVAVVATLTYITFQVSALTLRGFAQFALLAILTTVWYGSFLKRDPIGFASIVAPPIAYALLQLLRDPTDPAAQLPAMGWFFAWIAFGQMIWPWWRRNVLRRFRAGSPEYSVFEIDRQMRELAFSSDGPIAAWSELSQLAGELEPLITPRTRSTVMGLWSMMSALSDGSEERLRRVMLRLREEEANLWGPPPIRVPWRRSNAEPDRPTKGSSLEYEHPNLEAMIAAATPAEQDAIRRASARYALDRNGLLTDQRRNVLEMADLGPVDARLIDEIAAEREALYESAGAPGDWNDERSQLIRERAAISALSAAIEPLDVARRAADATYEAIQSLGRQPDVRELEALIVEIVGHEHAVAATPVPVVQPIRLLASEWTPLWIGTVAGTLPAQAALLGYAFVIGFGAKLADEFFSRLTVDTDDVLARRLLKIGVITAGFLVPALLFHVRSRRHVAYELFGAVVMGFAAWWIVTPISSALDILLGGGWTDSVRVGWTGVWPFAPIYGLSVAAVATLSNIIVAAQIRTRGWSLERAPKKKTAS